MTTFGGTYTDWVATRYALPFTDSSGQRPEAIVVADSVSLTCYDVATGAQVVGLTPTADSDGFIGEFTDPADHAALHISGDGGATRRLIIANGYESVAAHLAQADPHPQYLRDDVLTAPGDLVVGSGGGPVRLPVGLAGQVLTVQADGSLAYGAAVPDTEWRDIRTLLKAGLSVSTASGICKIRRVGPVVYAKFRLDVSADGITGLLTGIPAGFGPDEYFLPDSNPRTGTTAAAYYPNTGKPGYLHRTLGFQLPAALPNPGILEWITSYAISDPFPSEPYPGVPA